MTKTNTTKSKPTSSADEISKAIRDKQSVEQLDNTNRRGLTEQDRKDAGQALSPELIDDRMDGIMTAAAGLFFEPEERILADNGKAYPLGWDFEGRDYTSTEQQVTVDKYGFLSRQFARLQLSGLEMMLRNQDTAIAEQKKRIQNEIRFGRNAGTDVTSKVESMADFLGVMQEQRALTEVALQRGVERFNADFGEAYLTADARAKAAASRKGQVTGNGGLAAKLAALGVEL